MADGTIFYPARTPQDTPWPRINPAVGNSRIIASDSNSTYHSLQTDFTQRITHGLRSKVSYTFSKSIDETSIVISQHANGNSSAVENPFNFKTDRGLSAFDVRHNMVINFTYDLPFKTAGVLNKLVSGWQLASILTFQGGTPFTALTSFSRSRDQARSVSDRPNLVPGAKANHVSGTSAGCNGVNAGAKLGTPDLYFDPCSFALPAAGFYGNLGRDTVIGPGFEGTDVTLVKTTQITERWKADFRAEFFNIINRNNLSNPAPTNSVFDSAGTGKVLGSAGRIQGTTSSSRQIQFGLKLLF